MRRRPRIIPVIDMMNGQVVRAVGGRRAEYRPVRSRLTNSTDPIAVANALLAATGAAELYVADLDAIETGSDVSAAVVELVQAMTCRVWLDAGGAQVVAPHVCPVVGFESARTPDSVRGGSCATLSIDLRNGGLVGDWRVWELSGPADGIGLARRAVRLGVGTLIVLDLARVGTGSGCGTEDLIRAIRAEFLAVELIAGGGVRTWDDVDRLGDAGADAVLVASSLHDGGLVDGLA